MKNKEKELASKLLHTAANEFHNHGCNDVDSDLFEGWSDEEKEELAREMNEDWNGGEHEKGRQGILNHGAFLMDFFAWKLTKENN